jgi:hypothetical protein
MRSLSIMVVLALLAVPAAGVSSAMDIGSFFAGLSSEEKNMAKTSEERLVEMSGVSVIPRKIFRLDAEPYVALRFRLSGDGRVHNVEVLATNLDPAQDQSFIALCKKALMSSKFSKIEGGEKEGGKPAILVMRFSNPWKQD